jgi:hypothetical protein
LLTVDERMAKMRAASAIARRERVADRIASKVKRCSHCRLDLPFAAFSSNPCQPDGIASWCKSCHAAHARARWQQDRARQREAERFTFPLACCEGVMVNDPQIHWWRCLHKPDCTQQWQVNLGGKIYATDEDSKLEPEPEPELERQPEPEPARASRKWRRMRKKSVPQSADCPKCATGYAAAGEVTAMPRARAVPGAMAVPVSRAAVAEA